MTTRRRRTRLELSPELRDRLLAVFFDQGNDQNTREVAAYLVNQADDVHQPQPIDTPTDVESWVALRRPFANNRKPSPTT